jgi:PAS domain S-box-containing protein
MQPSAGLARNQGCRIFRQTALLPGTRIPYFKSMRSDLIQDQAALYVSGAMSAPERESLEVVLEFHRELRAAVARMEQVATAVALANGAGEAEPSAQLKERILAAAGCSVRPEKDCLVVTTPAGLVEWVNAEFTAMCGYELAELKGGKPGALLQGPDTDPAAVARIRAALREHRPCRETLVNYHKDGSAYRADIRISPVLAEDGEPLWFVARERKLSDLS